MAGQKEKQARLAAYQAEMAKQDAAGKEFLAQTSAKRADQERLMAEIATENAIKSSDIAQQKSLDARRSAAKALIAFDTATSALKRAQDATDKAIKNEVIANEQKDIANNERKKAIIAKGLSLAQSVAVKSWKVEDPDVQALLAQEAHGINKASEGRNNDAYIYEALYKAMDKMQNVKDNPDFNTLNIAPEGLDHIGAVRSIVVSNKEDERDLKLYTTGSDGWLLKWNLKTFASKEDRKATGKPEELARNKNDRVSRAMDMSPDGKYLVRGGDEEFIEVFDVAKKERKLTIDAHRGRRVWALEFLPDGNAVVSAGDDGSIKYSNLKGQVTPIVEGLTNRVTSISLSGDGQHVAGAGNSPAVSIWNVKTGQEEFKLDNPYNKQNATAVAISPAGRFVAVGYQDGAILIWDIYEYLETGKLPERLLSHNAKINDIAFSDDGTALLAGSLDKKATLWHIWDKKYEKLDDEKEYPFKDSKLQPIRLEDHEDWVLSVAFSHDGKKALTGCADGSVKIYEVEMARYSEKMCEMVKKNLSNKDWKKYIGTDDPEKDPRNQKLFIITAEGERRPVTTCGADYKQESDNK
jgi:WD40 repeat protein